MSENKETLPLPLEPPRLVRTDRLYRPPHRRRITQEEVKKLKVMQECICDCPSCIAQLDQGRGHPMHKKCACRQM
jgi:hypothetical protein